MGSVSLETSFSTKQDLSRKCSAWKICILSFCPPIPTSITHRVKYGWKRQVGVGGGPFLSFKVAYMSNLSPLQSLEAFEK